jgi:hypothetical protein
LLLLQNDYNEEEQHDEEDTGFTDNGFNHHLVTAQDNSYIMGRSFAGGKGGNNNTSIMGNFNPMTALETYENNNFGATTAHQNTNQLEQQNSFNNVIPTQTANS